MIELNNLKPIINLKKNEYKYLSPFIFKRKFFYILFCNRGKKSKFYGEINLLFSKNLKTWKQVKNFKIKPKKNSNISSFTSPCFVKIKGVNFIYIQAQGSKFQSKIIRFRSYDFKNWIEDKSFLLESKKFLFKSPYYTYLDPKYLYFSKENNYVKKICKINLKNFSETTVFKSKSSNEKFSVYSPTIFKENDQFIMIYAAWKNSKIGNLKVAISKDLKNWRKFNNYLFNIDATTPIVSEPNVYKLKNSIFIFFEYKSKSNNWNISLKKINLNKLLEIIK